MENVYIDKDADKPTFYAKTRANWREWLEKNGELKQGVYLIIYHKKSGTQSVYYEEAVEEALCFGWIDSKANKRTNDSYYLYFTRRKPNSNWSKKNIERAKKLVEQGLMTRSGMAQIELAKEAGLWKETV